MSQQRPEEIKVVNCFSSAWRVMRSILQDEAGVTAIEYALLATLIAIVASAGIAVLMGGVNGIWTQMVATIIAVL